MDQEQDLWPDFEDVPKINSPRSIMNEQGKFLSQKTKNLLNVEITSFNNGDGKISNRFAIVAPLLKNYAYSLFSLTHGPIYYPCEIRFKNFVYEIKDEVTLRVVLREIFNDQSSKDIISSLLGQSKEVDSSS